MFAAKYAGTCPSCRGPIHPGQFIELRQGAYRHTVCPTQAPVVAKQQVTEPGFYMKGEAIYKVQRAKSGSHLYGLVLTVNQFDKKARFEYVPGLVTKLAPENKLTREQAEAFGQYHGVCCICGATLTDPESVKRGIGPVCAKWVN